MEEISEETFAGKDLQGNRADPVMDVDGVCERKGEREREREGEREREIEREGEREREIG